MRHVITSDRCACVSFIFFMRSIHYVVCKSLRLTFSDYFFKGKLNKTTKDSSSPSMASIAKFKDWILETIDQLRKRKARPDMDRICHMVERRYGALPMQTQAELDRLVDAEVVIKVDYKGSTSYRNAAKWSKRSLGGHVLNSSEVSRTLVEAVKHLVGTQEQTLLSDSVKQGVSIADIAKYLDNNSQLKLFKNNKLQVALEREVIATHLEKLTNGNYVVYKKIAPTVANNANANANDIVTDAECLPVSKPKAKVVSDAAALKVIHSIPCKKGRPPNKRKRFKKTHGPDFVENYDALFEEPEPKCDYCLLTGACNSHGKAEALLFCKDCNAKAHPSCMDYSTDLAMRSRMSPWQCMDCKTCYVCDDSGDADSMLFCDACDKGFHMSCHVPMVTEKPSGKWVCCQCSEEIAKQNPQKKFIIETNGNAINQTVDDALGMPTPCESPVHEEEQNKKRFSQFEPKNLSDNKENTEIPDASEWTIEDVENYFKIVGFPDQASAFKEQEIDGKSLLLLKRSDVLTGLSIKLGPALKIYNHVKRLQTRRPDGHLIC